MKRIFIYIIIMIGLFPILVNAEEYSLNTLIPVDTKATVKTEKFDYNNIVYNSSVDSNGKGIISFESINNNTHSKTPISINILLFGDNKKNIGFLTYCTDKDLDSNYSGYKLSGNSSTSFSISVVPKYFIDGKSAKDVKYIAVMDDNKYCKIGGYTNYKDQTIEEIINNDNKNEATGINKIIVYIQENNLLSIIILSMIGLVILIILIMIIKGLIKRSKNKPVSYKPHDDAPLEETVDLGYDNVEIGDYNSDNINVSMGSDKTTNTLEEDKKEEKEEESDLTKFF